MPIRALGVLACLLLIAGPACSGDDEPGGGDAASNSDTHSPIDGGFPDIPGLENCGDGEINGIEECDNGASNSDVAADACRVRCELPRCGDAVMDTGEACDDGNVLSGDGCSRACVIETIAGDLESNDSVETGIPVASGDTVTGTLTEGDIDCYAVDVEGQGWVSARSAALDGSCTIDTTIRLVDANGSIIASAQDTEDGFCSFLNPETQERARYLEPGRYAVCIEGLLRTAIDGYQMVVEFGSNSCDQFEPSPEDDPDGDGIADPCDDDDDGDGAPDISDNCPSLANGETELRFVVGDEGFVQNWLLLGDFDQSGGTNCLPSEDQEAGRVSELGPEFGDTAGGRQWRYASTTSDRLNLGPFLGQRSGQAVWALVYVMSPSEREIEVRVGSDDGVRAWLNGEQLLETDACRGVNRDQNVAPATLMQGRNTFVMKVRNNGGAWGLLARFVDLEGVPLTDLVIELTQSNSRIDAQADSDSDGVGDLCDGSPFMVEDEGSGGEGSGGEGSGSEGSGSDGSGSEGSGSDGSGGS
jgi:cysteine-rich repeat protein